MKGKKWVLISVLSFFLSFIGLLGLSSPVSAFSFGVSRSFGWSNSSDQYIGSTYGSNIDIYYNPTDGTRRYYFVQGISGTTNRSIYLAGGTQPSAGTVTSIRLVPNQDIPANSLIALDIRMYGRYSLISGFSTSGFTSLISQQCEDNLVHTYHDSSSLDYTFDRNSDLTCHLLVYTSSAISNTQYLTFSGQLIEVDPTQSFGLSLNAGSYINMITESGAGGSSGLTQADKDFLAQQFASIVISGTSDSADIIDKLDEVIQSNQDNIDAINNPEWRDDERQELDDAQDDASDTAYDESAAAQSTATNLLAVVGQFVTTLTNAQPTNCNINGNLIPHLPLGNLNLCQNSPPSAITALGSLILIAFVVSMAYHVVKRMLALIGSFQR